MKAEGSDGTNIDLPQFSIEEKLVRTVRNIAARDIGGIAYAKSIGKTPEDYGEFFGELTAFFWADIKGKGPVPFVQNLHRFLQTDSNLKMEILSISKTSVTVKMTVYGETHIGAFFEDLGVTREEYVRYLGKNFGVIADRLGLCYEQTLEGDWLTITLNEKE